MASQPSLREAPSKYHGVRMSLEEYEALPEEKPYLEYWDGVVIQKAVPRRKHWKLQAHIAAIFVEYARRIAWGRGNRSARLV